MCNSPQSAAKSTRLASSRTVRITDARGYHTTLEYNALDQMTKLKDANGNVTTFQYDSLGRNIRRTDALNHVATYAYDALHRMTSTTDRAAVRRDCAFDEANHRRTEKWYSTDNTLVETLTFTYDAAGNLTGAANSAGVYTIAYDPANRPDVVQGLFGLTMIFFSAGSDVARIPIGSFSEPPAIGRH